MTGVSMKDEKESENNKGTRTGSCEGQKKYEQWRGGQREVGQGDTEVE